ncbi:MAG: hypothetical protein ACJ71T_07900 [Actinomycetales bacterium]
MNRLTKTASAFAAAGLLVGGVAAGGAFAKTTSGGTALNVPDGKASTLTAAATTVPQRVFAVVNADGTKLRGKAVASTAHLSSGVYDVRFNRNLSTCAWTGTVGFGTFSGSTGPSMISISGRAGTNNGLFVQTFDAAGTPTDLPFSAIAICS